jgi:polysaccharide biosynthesis/export protein
MVSLAVVALQGAVVPAHAQDTRNRQDTRSQQDARADAVRREAERRAGRPMTHEQVVDLLQESGLSRSQMRTRLQQAGYDPGLADRYFDVMDRGGTPPRGEAGTEFMQALTRIGMISDDDDDDDDEDLPDRDPLSDRDGVIDPDEVFGLATFRRTGTQFQPSVHGPVDPGYRLGPGDELTLVLTGDVESAYTLSVSREGHIFLPDVGQIAVNNLTLAQLEDVLFSRLGRVYSGISRSPNAATRFQVSLGQLRMNQVVITGDVARPGSYQVSSVAGVFNALYQAGGPTENGSFRRVEIHRGGRVVHVADLYDFLVRGSGASDARLEHNDRIFVPPAGVQVQVTGSVRRPAVYEMAEGETVADLMAFAGGLRSDALVRRVQIDRVLPPTQQQPGRYRTLVDVDLAALAGGGSPPPLVDGDVVHVFAVSDTRRNRVFVEGEVHNPGLYEWTDGSTLWSTLNRADGLGERAYTARAHVHRLVESDGSRRLISVTLERDEAGRPLHDLPLADGDSIVVFSRSDLRVDEKVAIAGLVKNPDTYALHRGMTLRDLVLAAGGFDAGAYPLEAEISRATDPLRRGSAVAVVERVPLTSSAGNNGGNGNHGTNPGGVYPDLVPEWRPEPGELELRDGDRVFIRRAPGYVEPRQVVVSGEVLMPGVYPLAQRDERFSSLIDRAGGLTDEAHHRGVHVVRGGVIVAAELDRALRRPGDRNDIILMDGDSIHVPGYDPMVRVTGAVNFDTRVVFVPGQQLGYYIAQAGGYADNARAGGTTVIYANGERRVSSGRLFRRVPRVESGAVIYVPHRPEQAGTNWDQIISRTAAVLSATATALIAVSQLR